MTGISFSSREKTKSKTNFGVAPGAELVLFCLGKTKQKTNPGQGGNGRFSFVLLRSL